MRKGKLVTFAAGLGVLAAIALGGGAANAATPGLPYDNTDPSATGCSADAVTIASYPIVTPSNVVEGTMNVRYSAACGTNWVQANNIMPGTSAAKYIFREGDYETYFADSDYTVDAGLGWSYGMQLGAPGCFTVWTDLLDSSGNVVADSGSHDVC